MKCVNNLNHDLYLLLALLFRHKIIDITMTNYKLLLDINQYTIKNISKFRFYYIFNYIILKNHINLIRFIWFIYISLLETQELNWISYKYLYNNICYNSLIYINIYLLSKKMKLLINYSKFYFYNKIYKKFYFYKEFKIKVDVKTLFIYSKYLEYYRNIKYLEYLKNHKTLWNFINLKNILIVNHKKNLKYIKIKYYKAIIYKFFYAYRIICDKNFNNYILGTGCNSIEYIKINSISSNNDYFFQNIDKIKIFEIFYIILYKKFQIFMYYYMIFVNYIIYHKNIMILKKLRKFKCKHMLNLHLSYANLGIKYISYIYKYYFDIVKNRQYSDNNMINYNFLIYLIQKNLWLDFIAKKSILTYKIIKIYLIKYIIKKYIKISKSIESEPHKVNKFGSPSLQKMWQVNYVKNLKIKSALHAPLYTNKYKSYIYEDKISNITAFNKNLPVPKNQYVVGINWKFLLYWRSIIKWSIIQYYNIINFYKSSKEIYNMLFNYKSSQEKINNNIYNNYYKYDYNFITLNKHIIISNIINLYLYKFKSAIINYCKIYSKDHFNIFSLCFSLLKDFFPLIYDFSDNNYEIITKLKKNLVIINKYKKNYNNFFLWQTKNYLSLLRFSEYYYKYEYNDHFYVDYFLPITYKWELDYHMALKHLHERFSSKLIKK